MGFKKIDKKELETGTGPCFIGMPLVKLDKSELEKLKDAKIVQDSFLMEKFSEILIECDEFLEFQYLNNGKRKSQQANGNISIINKSKRDRIWDTQLEIEGSHIDILEANEGNSIDFGILEPNSTKNKNYNIETKDNIFEMLHVKENIDVISIQTEILENITDKSDQNLSEEKKERKNLLISGKENKIKYNLTLRNVSTKSINNLNVKKSFSKDFKNFTIEGESSENARIIGNYLEWTLDELAPNEERMISIITTIVPRRDEIIRSGNIEITGKIGDFLVSGVNIENFTAYSHAMHAIQKFEDEHIPNKWNCSLIFENHSDFKINLVSILVFDKSKSKKFIEFDYNSSNEKNILRPGEKFVSEYWYLEDEHEPKFSRKIEYSVDYKVIKTSNIKIKIEDVAFDIVDLQIEKKFSEDEIGSFKKSEITNNITIENKSTIPVRGLIIREIIPEDFLPNTDISNYTFNLSSGKISQNDIVLNITPNDDDSTKIHVLELKINLKRIQEKKLVAIKESLEIHHPILAVTPNHDKNYQFPLEIISYFFKYDNKNEIKMNEYYKIENNLTEDKSLSVKLTYKPRKLITKKEIFPGVHDNEFAIEITVINQSNVEIKNTIISDMFPESFELLSSNLKYELTKPDKEGNQIIKFTIENVLPYQEKEIVYYLKNKSGKQVKFSKLESYFFG